MLFPQPLCLFNEGPLVTLIKKPWIENKGDGRIFNLRIRMTSVKIVEISIFAWIFSR